MNVCSYIFCMKLTNVHVINLAQEQSFIFIEKRGLTNERMLAKIDQKETKMAEEISPSKTPKGEETKRKILEKALDLFSELGYEKASIRKITAEVGIRESALYNHFSGKEEILAQMIVLIDQAGPLRPLDNKPLQEAALKGKRFLYEIASHFKLISFDIKSEKLFRFIVLEMVKTPAIRKLFVQQYYQNYPKKLSEAFFAMMQEGMIRSGDPLIMAQEFLAPLLFYRLQIALFRLDQIQTPAMSTLFEKHVDFFWESIAIKTF